MNKAFTLLIFAVSLLTAAALIKMGITHNVMVDDNAVTTRWVMMLIAAMFLTAVVTGCYAYWKSITRQPGFDLSSTQTTRLAQAVMVIATFMPPMLSNDFSIYMAHGDLLTKGILTYTDGTRLQSSDFFKYVSFHWRDCPNFYGPPLLGLFSLSALAGGKSILVSWLVFKVINTVILFFFIRAAGKYTALNPGANYNQLAIATLAPVVWVQAVGQGHVDGIILTLTMWSLYFFRTHRNWFTACLIGLIISIKVLYAVVFVPFALAVLYIQSRHTRFRFGKNVAKTLAAMVFIVSVCYAFVWEGFSTITTPLTYHHHKPPANSLTSAITDLIILTDVHEVFPIATHDGSVRSLPAKRKLRQSLSAKEEQREQFRIASNYLLSNFFSLVALLLAAFNMASLAVVRSMEEVFYIFGKVMIIVVCFYSPIFHPWYLMLPLPFLIHSEKRSWMIWWAVVPALACLHEIKFVIPRNDPFYLWAEGLIYPALAACFLFFRKHFIIEPIEALNAEGRFFQRFSSR